MMKISKPALPQVRLRESSLTVNIRAFSEDANKFELASVLRGAFFLPTRAYVCWIGDMHLTSMKVPVVKNFSFI